MSEQLPPLSYIDTWHEILYRINKGETAFSVPVLGPKYESERILRRYANHLCISTKVNVYANKAHIQLAHPKLDMKERLIAKRMGLIK